MAAETHVAHLKSADLVVEISSTGDALFCIRPTDGNDSGDLWFSGEDLADLEALWKRATRAEE